MLLGQLCIQEIFVETETLICTVIRGDSFYLLFKVKMNFGLQRYSVTAICWCLQRNNKHLSPQLISLVIILPDHWSYLVLVEERLQTLQPTYYRQFIHSLIQLQLWTLKCTLINPLSLSFTHTHWWRALESYLYSTVKSLILT